MAGVIGIIRSWGIIKSAVGLAAKEMGGKGNVEKSIIRTQRDLSMKIIAIGSIITLILIVLFFYLDVMQGNLLHTLVAIVLVAGISFLFTTVAANAIAIVGTNPVSGMTLMTLILASVVMVAVGLKGPSGMVAALVMGGVVCTALSMAGGFITDLKFVFWRGSTPVIQDTWKFLGTIVSAATVGGVMIILNKTYGFTSGALAAPQANAMAAVIEPLMSGVGAPWLLYGIGSVLAFILTLCKIPGDNRFCCNRRRCNDYLEQVLRIHKRRTRCSTGKCNGSSYRTVDERCWCSLLVIRYRSGFSYHFDSL